MKSKIAFIDALLREAIEQFRRLVQQPWQRLRGARYPQPKHDIERVQRGPPMTHCLPKQPAQVVALDGARELFFADYESRPPDRAFRGRREQLKMRAIQAPTGPE